MLGRNPLTEKKGRMINAWPCAGRATLQKIASAARSTGGGELRFGLRFHCQHARVKFGRRKWLAATTGATGDRPPSDRQPCPLRLFVCRCQERRRIPRDECRDT